MTTISASTTINTAYNVTGDTTGTLVFKTGASPTTAMSIGTNQVVTFANPPTGVFPSGTAMMFVQTSAPTGWTKSTAHDNKALRVVSGTASSGGSVAFTTAFASQSVSGTVGATTLDTTMIPSHNHTLESPRGTASGSGFAGGTFYNYTSVINDLSARSTATGGGGSHTHSFSGTAINLAVQYVDVIIATKD